MKITVKTIRNICLVGIVIMIFVTLFDFSLSVGFVRVNAVITDVRKETRTSTKDDNSKDTHILKYVTYKYKYGNKYYFKEALSYDFNEKVGYETHLYIDPNNPERVKLPFVKTTIICVAFWPILGFIITGIILLRREKGTENENEDVQDSTYDNND